MTRGAGLVQRHMEIGLRHRPRADADGPLASRRHAGVARAVHLVLFLYRLTILVVEVEAFAALFDIPLRGSLLDLALAYVMASFSFGAIGLLATSAWRGWGGELVAPGVNGCELRARATALSMEASRPGRRTP
jgi:hypothetical protein